jgi:hypothetical protein
MTIVLHIELRETKKESSKEKRHARLEKIKAAEAARKAARTRFRARKTSEREALMAIRPAADPEGEKRP